MKKGLLLFTYGGPETMEEVEPFIREILHGRPLCERRLAQILKHYALFHGKSPLNDASRQLFRQLREKIDATGLDCSIFWGCRYAEPRVETALEAIFREGIEQLWVFVPTPFGGYSDIYTQKWQAFEENHPTLTITSIPPYASHPLFQQILLEMTREKIETLSEMEKNETVLVYSVHSLPVDLARQEYQPQVLAAMEKIERNLRKNGLSQEIRLGWQSESRRPENVPWLRPRLKEVFQEVAEKGFRQVLLIPLGFSLDNMEVAYDLDIAAVEWGRELGLKINRLPTASHHSLFVEMILRNIATQG
ncbi:MAG: ferrochelatase [Planctomycetia bacterium]|nr:ferrochelatase [Planctomycetia bacterium]